MEAAVCHDGSWPGAGTGGAGGGAGRPALGPVAGALQAVQGAGYLLPQPPGLRLHHLGVRVAGEADAAVRLAPLPALRVAAAAGVDTVDIARVHVSRGQLSEIIHNDNLTNAV